MGGHKKNKRGSIPSSMSSTSKTEMIERTPENDYGVLSDPEENGPSSPVHLFTEETETAAEAEAGAETETEKNVVVVAAVAEPTDSKPAQSGDAYNYNPSELSQTSHVSPHSSPSLQASSQPQHPSSQLQISQDQSSKSLNALKLKLTTDKNYSKKITLHTFFSYAILAIEIERASSPSIARISTPNVEKLVEYMIEHHSATDDIKIYLRTLLEIGVIKNIISAVIDFNKDKSDSLDKLLSAEQMELEMVALKETADAGTGTGIIQVTISTSDAALSHNAPQTSQSCSFFKCLRRFFSGCCGNSR